MNKTKTTFVLSCLCLCLTAKAQTDLEECIRLAYGNYPQIQEYDLIEASRGYDINSAAKAWIPQLSISGKASWQSTVVEMPFSIPGYEFNIPHDQYGITADISQQIWDGGASAIKRKLIDTQADVKARQLEVNMYALRSRVQNLYLGINLLDRQMELNEVLKTNLLRTLEEMDTLVENGIALSSDRDQIKVSILSCDQQKLALESDRRAYVQMLSLLTGRDLHGEVFKEPKEEPQKTGSIEIARPELDLYDAQAKQISLQRDQLNINLSPRLNLNIQAGYGRPGLNMLYGEFDPYIVTGLKLQWNLGNLYTLKNDRRKSDAEASRIELTRKSFLLNTTLEATQKENEMKKAAEVLACDEQIIALRENIRESAEKQYKEGIIKMNDYLNMLDEEFKARLNSNVHAIQYIMAVFDLKNTTGK